MDSTINRTPYKDVTDEFEAKKYWGGYNTPYFKEIGDFLGYEYGYEDEERSKIIKEWAPGPMRFDALKSLIWFNNRTIEENPCGSIAPWCDLGPSKYAFGAVDAKVTWTSWRKQNNQKIQAVLSPTFNENLPYFTFNNPDFINIPQLLGPILFNKTWIDVEFLNGTFSQEVF